MRSFVFSPGASTVKNGNAHTLAPRHRYQQHHARPTQTRTVYLVLLARPRRIAKYAFLLDLGSPASLQRLICCYQDRHTRAPKDQHQHSQKNTAHLQSRPLGSIQNTMVVLELLFIFQTQKRTRNLSVNS